MPILTIIVPIFNIEKYLTRCIESILSQELSDMEIILVNDGSTDSCAKLCDSFVNKDKRFRVIHKSNGGLSSARNTGIDEARGQYIGFVDGDDAIAPTFYSTLIESAQSHSADIVMSGYTRKSIDGANFQFPRVDSCAHSRILNPTEVMESCILPFFGYSKQHRLPSPFASCCDKIYRKEFIADLRFKSERKIVAEDNLFNLTLFLKSPRFIFEPTYNYFYYEVRTSLTSSYSIKQLDGYLNLGLELRTIGSTIECDNPISEYLGTWIFFICTSLLLSDKPIRHFSKVKELVYSPTFQSLVAPCPKRSSRIEQVLLNSLRKPSPFLAWSLIVSYGLIRKLSPRFRIRPSYLSKSSSEPNQ